MTAIHWEVRFPETSLLVEQDEEWVLLMKGDISVTSEPNKGTAVNVSFLVPENESLPKISENIDESHIENERL